MKYILSKYGTVAIFSDSDTHSDMARGMHWPVVGAGFVDIMKVEEIEEEVNIYHKAGGVESSLRWRVSGDTHFADGKRTNPCDCEQNMNRRHYLLSC